MTGNGTFDAKDTLKQLGCRWDGSSKAWVAKGSGAVAGSDGREVPGALGPRPVP